MKLGEVQRSKKGTGKSVYMTTAIKARRSKSGAWIIIHLHLPGPGPSTVSNNPNSVRYHPALFEKLRRILLSQNCWPFGNEGADTVATEARHSDVLVSRFNPVAIRGQSLSATIIKDRGER